MSQNNLCIIPARGGSKRIPRKNIRPFLGKPIIAYSIEAALKSGLFKEVMVSTDDLEIAKIATSYGAKVPFLRSIINSNDVASTMDVLVEVKEWYKEREISFDAICCIYPTSPFIQVDKLVDGNAKLLETGCDTVLPVVRFSYPIHRALQMTENYEIKMVWPENLTTRSQDLPSVYHDAGQWYWIANNAIGINTFSGNCTGVELSEIFVQDIDNETDWMLAEMKFQYLLESGNIRGIK